MGFCGSPSTALDDAAAAGTAADDDGTAADDAGTAADDDAGTAADDAGTVAADDDAGVADGDAAVADGDGTAADDGGALAHGGTAVDGGASSQSISVCVSASGSWLSFFTSLPSIMTRVYLLLFNEGRGDDKNHRIRHGGKKQSEQATSDRMHT